MIHQISIHALLAESDRTPTIEVTEIWISIHALLAESDKTLTLTASIAPHFYPRSPCGERQRAEHHANSQQEFLSTLSLRRATPYHLQTSNHPHNFYPRSPCGERPTNHDQATNTQQISIHALLAESDREPTAFRTPHHKFLSTLSLRRATCNR